MARLPKSHILGCMVAVGVVGASVPPSLAGQWGYASNLCSSGSFCANASVEVTTYWDGTKTNVAIRMRNWSGMGGTKGYSISGVDTWFPDLDYVPWGSQGPASTFGQVAPVGEATLYSQTFLPWYLDRQVPPGLLSFGDITGDGVLGCDAYRWELLPAGGYSTCQPGSWVVFSFTTDFQWSASDPNVQIGMWIHNQPNSYSYGDGRIELDCRGAGCVITPEPVTITLVATGLVGIGLLRRRRKTEVQ